MFERKLLFLQLSKLDRFHALGMARRKTVNRTGLARIEGIAVHDAFVGFICLKCSVLNHVKVGEVLLDPETTFANVA